MVSKATIQDFSDKLIQYFKPEKIVLFGSYAKGKPSENSDVDLLVIMKTNQRPIKQEVLIKKRIQRDFPLDLIVITPKSLKEKEKKGDPFINSIVKNGQVIYEKNYKRMA